MEVIKPDVAPGRLRRIVAHPASLLALGFVLFSFLYAATMAAVTMLARDRPALAPVIALAGAVAGWSVYRMYRLRLEGPPNRELELAGAGRELSSGLLFGFLLFSAVTAIVALLGGFRIEGVRGAGNLLPMIAIAIFSGFYEELIFRGVLMRQLEALLGTYAALALTSAFFGLVHIVNPDSTVFAALAISVEAGILLGAAYLLTRRLWLAIGIHAAWNFTQGWIYSIPISGTGESEGLLVTTRNGPEWLTGGDFGLEASVVALIVATAAGLFLLRRAAMKGEIRPWGWRRRMAQSPAGLPA